MHRTIPRTGFLSILILMATLFLFASTASAASPSWASYTCTARNGTSGLNPQYNPTGIVADCKDRNGHLHRDLFLDGKGLRVEDAQARLTPGTVFYIEQDYGQHPVVSTWRNPPARNALLSDVNRVPIVSQNVVDGSDLCREVRCGYPTSSSTPTYPSPLYPTRHGAPYTSPTIASSVWQ